MSATGDSLDQFISRTGSSRGVSKQNGEIIARPHPTMKKSYSGNADAGKNKGRNRFVLAALLPSRRAAADGSALPPPALAAP